MFGERLKALRIKNGVTQKELSAIIGVDRTSVGKYEIKNVTPNPDILKSIADYFGVSIDYLLGRDMSSERLDNEASRGMVVAKSIKYLENKPVLSGYDGEISVHLPSGEDIVAIRCNGDSMSGMGIFDGDIAIVRCQDSVGYGEVALVTVDEEDGELKKVKKKDSVLVLESANINYSPRIFIGQDCSRVRIIGKLLQVIKQF